ncbi:MAG: sigma-70 family RNA polymerase sigma factor [Planctomycetes bacterium]|nr:sigma-70 family RNA polymerase sigma factor [Planctomycetota bacterium]MBL7184955.1 sigma-70 family RNA polymerase sigma factor [Phycisphaerae bacterium]
MTDVTRILDAVRKGDVRAADELLAAVYQELRRLAAVRLGQEPAGQTLQATALVHEAYIRLVGIEDQSWEGRGHFFAAAAEAMRRILIERARHKRRRKRGADRQRIDLDDATLAIEGPSEDVIAVDEALTKLGQEDKIVADLVKMRYFAGLNLDQIAKILGISRRTADRYWAYARAWLHREITRHRIKD